VYEGYFRAILRQCAPFRPILEIGSGPGFFKEFCPESIATDIEPSPWIDRVIDGTKLPFDDREVGNIVMVDVFHHLPRPGAFLAEAARALTPGGRIVMLEPWTSVLGYPFYRHIHHEGADRHVNPENPFTNGKTPFDGNAAIPRLFFYAHHKRLPESLRVLRVQRKSALCWLFTGGFRDLCLLPARLVPMFNALDAVLAPLAGLIALRALITLERTTG
jgi:SAM-dependent methyltransferase